MNRLVLFSMVLLTPFDLMAQQTFQRVIGGQGDDLASCATPTLQDGGYVIAGNRSTIGSDRKLLLMKLDASGSIQWTNTYSEFGPALPFDIREHQNGQLWVAGSCDFDGDHISEAFFMAVDSSGVVLWTHIYNEPYTATAFNFCFLADGGAVFTLYLQNPDVAMGLVRVDMNGNVVWKKKFMAAGTTFGGGVIERPNGDLVCVGRRIAPTYDVLLFVLDSSGTVNSTEIWASTYGNYDGAYSIAATSDGGYLIAGESWGTGIGSGDVLLIRVDSALNTEWARIYGTPGRAYQSLAAGQCADGGFYCGIRDQTGDGQEQMELFKTDPNGQLQWSRSHGVLGTDVSYKASICPDGGFLLVGGTVNFGATGRDYYIIKTDQFGQLSETVQACNSSPSNLTDSLFDFVTATDTTVVTSVPPRLSPTVNRTSVIMTHDTLFCDDFIASADHQDPDMSILLYPIPCNDRLSIKFLSGSLEEGLLRIYDALGRKCMTSNITSSFMSLDISSYPAGEYILLMETPRSITVSRVAVLH